MVRVTHDKADCVLRGRPFACVEFALSGPRLRDCNVHWGREERRLSKLMILPGASGSSPPAGAQTLSAPHLSPSHPEPLRS